MAIPPIYTSLRSHQEIFFAQQNNPLPSTLTHALKEEIHPITVSSLQIEQLKPFFQVCGFDENSFEQHFKDCHQNQENLFDSLFTYFFQSTQEIKEINLNPDLLLKMHDSKGMNIFFAAIREGKRDAMLRVIQLFGEDTLIALKNTAHQTALHIAAIYDQEHLIEDLTREGLASCMDEDHDKLIPLHWSIHEGHVKTTEKLLAMTSLGREWIPSSSSLRISSLALAIASGSEEILSLLLKCNAFKEIGLLDLILPFGTVIHLTIQLNQSRMLKYLLEAQHQDTRQLLETKDPYGRTPLQLAAFLGDLFAIQELVQKNCLIHQGEHNSFGTALHFAVKGEKPEAISLLLSLGADSLRVDDQGKAPLAYLQKKPLSPSATRCKNILENYQRSKKLEQIYPADFKERAPFNVIFEGTADRKEPFIGAIQALESKKIVSGIRRFSGLGMGSIIATLLSIGYKSFELEELPFGSLDHLFQESQEEHSTEQLQDLRAFYQHLKNSQSYAELKHCGKTFCNVEQLKQQLEDLIKNSTTISHLTFGELSEKVCIKPQQYKHLHLAVFSLKTHQVMHISSEDPRFKELIISDVLAASLAFPGIFQPVTLRRKNHEGSLYFDEIYGQLIAPFREISLVDLFDDSSYQEDPYLQGRKTNYRTLSLQMHHDIDASIPPLEGKSSRDLLHSLLAGYKTLKKPTLSNSLSRGRIKPFSTLPLEDSESIIIKSQQQIEALFSLSKEIEPPLVPPLGAAQEEKLTPWKYDLFFMETLSFQKTIGKKENTRLCNLPDLPSGFTGRESPLQAIQEAFKTSRRIGITGLGGVGKSILSLKYGHTLKEEIKLIHFIRAKSQLELIQGIIELAGLLGIKGDKPEDILDRVKIHLQKIPFPFLLIVDGLDDPLLFQKLNQLIPSTKNCKILVTTREEFTAYAQGFLVINLASFSSEESITYLLNTTKIQPAPNEHQAAQELTTALGGLPLALSHVSRYIIQQRISLREYYQLFQDYHLKLLEKDRVTLTPEEQSVLTTWNISLKAIESAPKGKLAQDLIQFIAFIGNNRIPFDFLFQWLSRFYRKEDKLSLHDALGLLCNYSFIQKDALDSEQMALYQTHALVQKVTLYHLSQLKKKDISSQVCDTLKYKIQSFDKKEMHNRNILVVYSFHTEQFLKIRDIHDLLTKIQTINLFSHLITLYHRIFEYPKALEYSIQRLQLVKEEFGKNSFEAARFYQELAITLTNLAQNDKALEYATLSLNIYENSQNQNPIQVIRALYYLGKILEAKGEFLEAMVQIEKALIIHQNHCKDLSSTQLYICVATISRNLGKIEEALDYAEKALANQKATPSEGEEIIEIYDSLSLNLSDLNRKREALTYAKLALEKKQELYGELSLHTAEGYRWITNIHIDLRNSKESLENAEKGLKINQKLFGDDGLYTAESHQTMANSLKISGVYSDLEIAVFHARKALQIKQQKEGKKTICVAESHHILAEVLKETGAFQEALEHALTAASIKEAIDQNSRYTAHSYQLSAYILENLGRLKEAQEMTSKVITIKLSCYGELSRYTAESYDALGRLFHLQNNLQEAKINLLKSLEIQEGLTHKDDAFFIQTQQELGKVFDKQLKQYDEIELPPCVIL